MRLNAAAFVILALTATAPSLAQDVESDDLPSQCRSLCASTIRITRQCDTQTDDDGPYFNCVCNAQGASSAIPRCEACVAQYDEPDNDVRDILNACNFALITAAPSSASSPSSTASLPSAVTTSSSVATVSGLPDDDDDDHNDHDHDHDDDSGNDPDDHDDDDDDNGSSSGSGSGSGSDGGNGGGDNGTGASLTVPAGVVLAVAIAAGAVILV